uniref:hypothetical protein n=1 Tax=Helicobacter salomonis TaxID=56878 RepID=UPI0013153083
RSKMGAYAAKVMFRVEKVRSQDFPNMSPQRRLSVRNVRIIKDKQNDSGGKNALFDIINKKFVPLRDYEHSQQDITPSFSKKD